MKCSVCGRKTEVLGTFDGVPSDRLCLSCIKRIKVTTDYVYLIVGTTKSDNCVHLGKSVPVTDLKEAKKEYKFFKTYVSEIADRPWKKIELIKQYVTKIEIPLDSVEAPV